MLLLKAKVMFGGLENNLSTKIALMPGVNFGNGLTFSGIIKPIGDVGDFLFLNEWYEVDIEMFTINEEAFPAICHLVKEGNPIDFQVGSRKVGKGEIMEHLYIEKNI
ncbi:hypothetical protein [Cohnella hashimotonis]|uniref:Translation elongation factor EFTu-like domain-containing protein n=1 Tax=Cohnella hashimotonis TaxID=2826895 RepID=A0ABT6TQ95_9BACL|nr:hypothetical protein [Cohnella hashimotonis]MDI4647982.1 hypothetical protein [Cohnella hashimotonis]